MRTRIIRHCFAAALLMIFIGPDICAQKRISLSLDSAVNLALEKNHLLNIKKLQVEEKQQKVNEDRIKYLPTIVAGGQFQYNTSLPSITIEQGRFGSLPLGTILIPLPAIDEVISMGNHRTYQAGVTLYQPLTQLGKINAGVGVSRTEYKIAQAEESKAVFHVKQAVEKLFFGILITEKQIEESGIKVSMAKARLSDVQSALSAGKTTESGLYGLAAAEADEEQTLLKLKIQCEDYSADLRQATGLSPDDELALEPVKTLDIPETIPGADSAMSAALQGNSDLRLASLYKMKADNAIRASKYSYLPDLGLLGGYTYQEGTSIYPKNNAFIGASFKWNIQDLLTTRSVQLQRISARKQAEENLLNTKEQVNRDLAKAVRKLKQSEELIKVVGKVVEYRRADLKIQSDRRSSGLNLEADLLTAQAAMVKAESDYYAALLNYRIALSEFKILTGKY